MGINGLKEERVEEKGKREFVTLKRSAQRHEKEMEECVVKAVQAMKVSQQPRETDLEKPENCAHH